MTDTLRQLFYRGLLASLMLVHVESSQVLTQGMVKCIRGRSYFSCVPLCPRCVKDGRPKGVCRNPELRKQFCCGSPWDPNEPVPLDGADDEELSAREFDEFGLEVLPVSDVEGEGVLINYQNYYEDYPGPESPDYPLHPEDHYPEENHPDPLPRSQQSEDRPLIELYEDASFSSLVWPLESAASSSFSADFGGVVSACVVERGFWMLYAADGYQSDFTVVGPGTYPTTDEMRMTGNVIRSARPFPPITRILILLFEGWDYRGRMVTITDNVSSLEFLGFNDQASSAIVVSGGWRLYSQEAFFGDFQDLVRGYYPILELDKRVRSADVA